MDKVFTYDQFAILCHLAAAASIQMIHEEAKKHDTPKAREVEEKCDEVFKDLVNDAMAICNN